MYRRILVPIDGSTFGEAALHAARSVAERANGSIRLLYVHEPINDYEYVEYRAEAENERAEAYVAGAAERLRATSSVPVSTSIRRGPVAAEILDEAQTATDLIVMATHGRGAFSRFWLGSVADQTIRKSPKPVLLIRPPEAGSSGPTSLEVSKVVIALDGSEIAEAALPQGLELAKLFGAQTVLVQSVAYAVGMGASSYLPMTDWTPNVIEERVAAAHTYLGAVTARLEAQGAKPTVHIVTDTNPAEAIIDAAGTRSVVVIATHGRGGIERALMGSVTDKVVRAAHGPVLVVRPRRKRKSRAKEPVAAGPVLA
jgi:nucleotide-binding universal stress UspA family protein